MRRQHITNRRIGGSFTNLLGNRVYSLEWQAHWTFREWTGMSLFSLPFKLRYAALTMSLLITGGFAYLAYSQPDAIAIAIVPLAVFGVLSLVGLRDLVQSRHAILRNYPIAAHLRFFFEEI